MEEAQFMCAEEILEVTLKKNHFPYLLMVQHFKHLLLEKQGASGGEEAEKVKGYNTMSIVNKITARLSPCTILLLQFFSMIFPLCSSEDG